MKVYITLAVVCLIASAIAHDLTEEEKAELEPHIKACVKEENVSHADVHKLQHKDFANASPAMKCFGACFYEKLGILKDGVVQDNVNLDHMIAHYGRENVKNTLNKCKNEKGANRCETGFKVFECIEKEKVLLGHHH